MLTISKYTRFCVFPHRCCPVPPQMLPGACSIDTLPTTLLFPWWCQPTKALSLDYAIIPTLELGHLLFTEFHLPTHPIPPLYRETMPCHCKYHSVSTKPLTRTMLANSTIKHPQRCQTGGSAMTPTTPFSMYLMRTPPHTLLLDQSCLPSDLLFAQEKFHLMTAHSHSKEELTHWNSAQETHMSSSPGRSIEKDCA